MKSYFALGVFVALSWTGLAAGARGQEPYFSSPSLLPLPEVQRDYPATSYPTAPVGGYQPSQPVYQAPQGMPIGQGVANNFQNAPQPAYQQPAYQQPAYQQPAYQPQAYQQPAYQPAPADPRGGGIAQRMMGGQAAPRGSFFGQRYAQNEQGSLTPGAPQSGPPEYIPTPAQPGENPYGGPHSPHEHHYNPQQTSPYMGAMKAPYGSGCAAGSEGNYGEDWGDSCSFGGGCAGRGWYGSAGGLIMGRTRGTPFFFSYFDANEGERFLTPQYNWGGGVQATVGKTICCGQYAFEAVYWGLFPGVNEQNVFEGDRPGNLNAFLPFAALNQLTYDGLPAGDFTDDALRHRLQSSYEIHNFEFNFINYTCSGWGATGCPSRCTYNFGAGIRWFRFRDGLQWASDDTDFVFNGADEELYYDISTVNDLIGFQFMGQGNYWLCNCLCANLGSKFGVYNNHVQHHSRIGGSAGDALVDDLGPFDGQPWNVTSNTNVLAFLGEIDAGLTYAFCKGWSVYGGYRVVAVSNVALTTNQIHWDLGMLNEVAAINTAGTLVLHGGYAGVQYCW